MPLDIAIGERYKLRSDANNFIIARKKIVTNKDTQEKTVKFMDKWYPATLEDACRVILKDSAKVSDATTLKQLMDEQRDMYALIRESLQIDEVKV